MCEISLFLDICEDPELKDRILQLRTEQENKKQAEAQRRRVRRSQSNTRAQSVRRTSLRDKGLTARRDAVEEVRLRMQAENTKVINIEFIPFYIFLSKFNTHYYTNVSHNSKVSFIK